MKKWKQQLSPMGKSVSGGQKSISRPTWALLLSICSIAFLVAGGICVASTMTKDQAIEVVRTKLSLPPRWTPLRPHPVQTALWNSTARFKVVPAGRRGGKTELAKRELVKVLPDEKPWPDPRYFAAAPTNEQARAIFWDDLKALTPKPWIKKIRESYPHTIETIFGSSLVVVGLDKPERIEGQPWDGGIIDEIGNVKPDAWPEHIRPALSDRRGWCWMIGVPEGRNHYYDLYQYALTSGDPEWAGFTWFAADILPAAEIAAMRRELDERTYRQEAEASFESYEGRSYWNFTPAVHVHAVEYRKELPLCLRFDFNETPMTCTTAQVYHEDYPSGTETVRMDHVKVIDEITIRNSNTVEVCNELLNRYPDRRGRQAIVYGDAYGNTSTTGETDYQIVDKILRAQHGWKLEFRIPTANPSQTDRTNAVNAMFRSIEGHVRTTVDPRCRNLIRDFERVTFKEGTRVIDKADPELTHWSDGHGYHIHYDYPVRPFVRSTSPGMRTV